MPEAKRKRMRRILFPALAAMLLICLLAGLVSCGKSAESRKSETQSAVSAAETVVIETAAAENKNAESESPESGEALTLLETPMPDPGPEEEITAQSEPDESYEEEPSVREDGEYTSKEEVAEYIHLYGHLPSNYITKKEAEALGWKTKGNLDKVAPGKSIGGTYFRNYEGLLPKKKGRVYYECDIDFNGKKRNEKRIVYSNDGLIFYTDDHYNSFEQLY